MATPASSVASLGVTKKVSTEHTSLIPEMAVAKQPHENKLVFSFKDHASSLLCYEQQKNPALATHSVSSLEWFRTLQAMAWIPSLKPTLLISLWAQAKAKAPTFLLQQHIDACLSPSSASRSRTNSTSKPKPEVPSRGTQVSAMESLRLKDRVARLLRETLAGDAVLGWSSRPSRQLRFTEFHAHDAVVTPMGLGSIRDVRPGDQMCVVVYPWGHGFCHRSTVLTLGEAKQVLREIPEVSREWTDVDQIIHELVSVPTVDMPDISTPTPECIESHYSENVEHSNPSDLGRYCRKLSPDTLEYVSSRCTPDQFTTSGIKKRKVL